MFRRASICVGLLALALSLPNALGQTFELQGGTSSQISATGASIGVTGPNYQGSVGIGDIQGHLRLGAYGQTWITKNVALAAGDDTTSMTLPTDIFTGGQYILTRGAGVLLGREQSRNKLYLFGGTTALGYGAGFFQAAEADTEIGLLYFDHQFSQKLHFFSRTAFSTKQTSISGLEWKPSKATTAAFATGVGSGQPYFASSVSGMWPKLELKAAYSDSGEQFRRLALTTPAVSEIDGANAAITYRPWSFIALTTSHNRYVTYDFDHGTSSTAVTDQGTANFSAARFGFGGSVYETSVLGQSARAYSFFASRPVQQWLSATVTAFRSDRWGGGTDSMFIVNVREKVHPRVSLSQFVTRADGSTNVTFGGELYTNPLRLSLDYQNIYVPFNLNQPFQQALSLNATAHVFGGTELTLGTFVDPFGKLRYTISISRYLYHNAGPKPGELASQWSMGKYLVRGRVVDDKGNPVSGAAVSIGGRFALTDVNGRFFIRFDKQKPEPVRVLPDEFTAPGFWKVLSAPATITPLPEGQGTEIEIRVHQLTGNEAKQKLDQERQQHAEAPAVLANRGS